jgi:hypothetical protein
MDSSAAYCRCTGWCGVVHPMPYTFTLSRYIRDACKAVGERDPVSVSPF